MELQFTPKQINTMSTPLCSTQLVIEILEKHCFTLAEKSKYIYHYSRPGSSEIAFREVFGGNHVFYTNKGRCYNVHQAIRMAVIK